jgi:GDP-mannose transporter
MTSLGDRAFFGQKLGIGVIISILLMFVGSVISGYNDMEFSVKGYFWVLVNCSVGASYTLYMKAATLKTKLGDFGNVYYNNLLSIPLLITFVLINGELYSLPPQKMNFSIFLLIFNGLASCFLSFASFWLVRVTSPTTHSIVGALNKIPTTIIGIIFFHTPYNIIGAVSMVIALFGGVFYAYSKKLEYDKKSLSKPIVLQPSSDNENKKELKV